ncbi:MAG: hypothetical protein IJF94_05230 [Eubacterium sp.]|nr:hypothetical protein [Eubacterium sp.]
MSQEKVDKRKQEKYARKNIKVSKKHKFKKYAAYVVATLLALLIIFWFVGSITGWTDQISNAMPDPIKNALNPVETTTASKAQVESIRNALIQNNDPNVKGPKTTTGGQQAQQAQQQVSVQSGDSKSSKKKSSKSSEQQAQTIKINADKNK